MKNEVIRRRKTANLPIKNDLGTYDALPENGLNLTRLNSLRELNWLNHGFNLMLISPSGTGKTFLAAGIGANAVEIYFKPMGDLTYILTLCDLTSTSMAEYKRLLKVDLIILGVIMFLLVEKSTGHLAFQLFQLGLFKNLFHHHHQ